MHALRSCPRSPYYSNGLEGRYKYLVITVLCDINGTKEEWTLRKENIIHYGRPILYTVVNMSTTGLVAQPESDKKGS